MVEISEMVNTKKGKVTGVKKGKGASNQGGSSSGSAKSAEAAVDIEEFVEDAEDGGLDEERLIEEEAERMMAGWRKMRSREAGQAGSEDSQEQRYRSARDKRTDGGPERRVLFRDRSRSPPVRSRQKEEELAAMRRQIERMA